MLKIVKDCKFLPMFRIAARINYRQMHEKPENFKKYKQLKNPQILYWKMGEKKSGIYCTSNLAGFFSDET